MSSKNVLAHMVVMLFSHKLKTMVLENNLKSTIQKKSSFLKNHSFSSQAHYNTMIAYMSQGLNTYSVLHSDEEGNFWPEKKKRKKLSVV